MEKWGEGMEMDGEMEGGDEGWLGIGWTWGMDGGMERWGNVWGDG